MEKGNAFKSKAKELARWKEIGRRKKPPTFAITGISEDVYREFKNLAQSKDLSMRELLAELLEKALDDLYKELS